MIPANLAQAGPEIPFSLQLKYEEAQNYLDASQWPEAVVALRAILKEAPRYSPGTIDLARALVNAGRREEALGALNQAIAIEGTSRRKILARRSRVVARTFFTQATFQIYQEGLTLLNERKLGHAREVLASALTRENDNIEILLRAGQAALLDGDFDSAAERLRLAKQLSPHEPEVRLWLGRVLHQKGEVTAGIEELRSAYAQIPEQETASVWLSDALAGNGQRAAGIQLLERHLMAHPAHVQALFALARLRYFGVSNKDPTVALWAVRKDLQVAMSRLDAYEITPLANELGLDLRDLGNLRNELQALMSRVESRIQGGPTQAPGVETLPPTAEEE